ncbi:MAG: hypothetical protein KDK05_13795 [Candidatus Competibacteraceae bacterium]|nr:hypothetical protein [Candidatus Competibacteraceae bacterium]
MLWTDERISRIAAAANGCLTVEEAVALMAADMTKMRDEYAACITELEAELQRCREQESARF